MEGDCHENCNGWELTSTFAATEETENTEIVFALSDFKGIGNDQLSFTKGQEIKVIEKPCDDWWWGELDGYHGYVPVNHLTYSPFDTSAWQNEEYFENYGNLKVHHEMLSDKPRTSAYQLAIQNNAELLNGKVILDVGCGTGIISMMCAKHSRPQIVYAVEASDIAEYTELVVRDNNLDDTVKVIKGHMEDIDIGRVDVIVSEWMGTILLERIQNHLDQGCLRHYMPGGWMQQDTRPSGAGPCTSCPGCVGTRRTNKYGFEMMIESVIKARDKFLVHDGILWPSSASLFLVPCSAHAQYNSDVEFWDNQFGFDLSSLKSKAKEDLLSKPIHNYCLSRDDCLSLESSVLSIDMKTVQVSELEHSTAHFTFVINKGTSMHGFCTWFEAEFCPLATGGESVSLNTGPDYEITHWQQNLFLLDDPITVSKGDKVKGRIEISRNPEWRRHLLVLIKFTVLSGLQLDTEIAEGEKLFHVWR